MKRVLLVLFLVLSGPSLFPASRPEEIDTSRTTAHAAALVALTAIPLILAVTADSRPGMRTENTAATITLSIPLAIAWPLFFHELSQARKQGVPRSPAPRP